MIRRVHAIALNTFREAVRQKVLYALVFFSVLMILFSFFLGQLSLGADVKIIKDVGLASIFLFGSLLAIFVGIGLVFKEVERRTIYTILSKPVSRVEFILGKYFGLAVTMALEVALMTALLFLLLSLYQEPLDWSLLKAVLLIYAELCVLIAVALVFSSYSSSFMSAMFCLSFLLIGHLTSNLSGVIRPKAAAILLEGSPMEKVGAHVLNGVAALMEHVNLDHFVINAKVVHGVPVSWAWILNSLFYALSGVTLLLTLAIALFRRKDLQ